MLQYIVHMYICENSETCDKLDLLQLCETQMFKFVLYGNIIFDTLFSKTYHMLGVSGTLLYAVFVYFVFALLTHGIVIFNILEQSPFQKYRTFWVFLALRHMLYLCILYLYFCICTFDTWEYNF